MKRFSVFLLVVALLAGGTVLSAPSHALSMLPFCGPEHPASRFPEEVSCDAQRHRPRPNPDRHADRHPGVRPQHRPNRPGCSHEQDGRRRNARYVVRGATVLYRGCVVEGASASSFRNLGGGYGCDAWHVFYDGFMMDGAAALFVQVPWQRLCTRCLERFLRWAEDGGCFRSDVSGVGRRLCLRCLEYLFLRSPGQRFAAPLSAVVCSAIRFSSESSRSARSGAGYGLYQRGQ